MKTNKLFLLVNLLFFFMLVTPVYSQPKSAKRGLGYGYHSPADMAAISKGISWWYNWSTQPETTVKDLYKSYDMEFVPMAWNANINTTLLNTLLTNDTSINYFLGYNEPNFIDQANMTPTFAASQWPKLETIANQFNLKLGSPAVNYCGNCVTENGITYTNPIKYLDDFFTACKGCRVDYIAIHWYACSGDALSSYINSFKKYNKPIWVTEFACWDNGTTLQAEADYLVAALKVLENDTSVFRYAWFTGRSNYEPIPLFAPTSGQLTTLGELYVNYPVHDSTYYYKIPARIEAESYSNMSGIDIQQTQDASGYYNVGWTNNGDWLEYRIEVPEANNYNFSLRTAGTTNGVISVMCDNVKLKDIAIPSTGNWQTWQTISDNINLPAGKHKLRFKINTAGFNINWFELTRSVITEISDISSNIDFVVYPNPANNELVVNLTIPNRDALGTLDVTVMNTVSQVVLHQSLDLSTSQQINISALPSGLYFIRVGDQMRKFTKL